MSNLSTIGISVYAEELEDTTEVVSDEELEDVAEENGSEENEPEEKKEEEVTEKVTEKGTEGSTEKVTEEITDNKVADETAESTEKDGYKSSEDETAESTEEDGDKSSEDETAENTEEDSEKASEEVTEKAHTPENITNQITQLKLNLGNAWYIDSEYGEVSLEEYDGFIDYSAISNISTVGLDVLYRLTQEGTERTVRSGDWYEITLPNIVSNVRLTGGESFGSDIPMDILDIQINGNTIKATFNQNIDDVDLSQIHGKQHIAFEVNKEALTEEISSYIVNLQPENNCELRLPAKVSKDVSASSAIDMEKITAVAESFRALLNDYFGESISEEQTPGEMYEIIQNAVAEMDEEKLNECNSRTMEALDEFDSLSFEEAEYFSENESYLYNTVMGSLSEVLSTIMTGEVVPMSLLPLEEIEAYLVLNGKSEEELKNMSLDEVLSSLVDKSGNSISILPEANTVWRYEKDSVDNVERYLKYTIGNAETIDLSAAGNVMDYQLELIVGSEHQLDPDNKRYIIKVFISEKLAEEFTFELYSQLDNQRTKIEPKRQEFVRSDSPLTGTNGNVIPAFNYLYYLDEDVYLNPYLGISSTLRERPDIRLEVYELGNYLHGSRTPVTNQVFDQDMSVLNSGFRMTDDIVAFLIFYYINDVQVDTIVLQFKMSGSVSELTGELFTVENGSRVLVSDNPEYSFSIKDETSDTYTFNLKPGYSADDEYSLCLNAVNGLNGNVNDKIQKAVLGYYTSLEEAETADDIQKLLFSNTGYKSSFGKEGKIFTIFFKNRAFINSSDVYHVTIKTVADDNIFKSFTEAPIIGEADSWFRITGAKDSNGNVLDTYVIENGKNINIDTMYGYGYQTVFISNDVSDFEPTFWLADTDAISIDSIYINGRKFNVGDTLFFADGENTLDATFSVVINDSNGRHTKNYEVRFVKRTGGPQLYVAGPLAPEIRSVFLDEYFEYKHDIFIANVGDEPLQDLRLELDATNVALDSYWTIGGEGNDTLAACPENFMADQISSSYGELPNVAKIRLIPDGDNSGDIKGTLKIFSGTSLLATINLSGRAQNPQITTEGFENAVKYVPYSYMITTNNMYDWNNVKLTIIEGELPPGMTFDSNTGEIYGAPLAAGEYKFTIKADFSRSDYFAPVTKEFTITVLDNENATVFNTSDSGYAIIPSEDGEIGFVGEQVSAYDFVVTTFDDDDMYISEGEYGDFANLWLNGEILVEGVDYTKAPGSTKITIKAQTLENKTVPGRNTISAEYNIDGERGEKLKRTSQNFRVDIKKPSDPTPKPSDPTPGPSDPTPGPTGPTDPIDPTPSPTMKPTDSTSGTNSTINNPNNSTQTTVETISIMTISAVDANDAPLASTTIEVHSTPKTAVTDENGNASFTDVEFGTHTIYVKNEDGSIMSSKNFELAVGSNLSINGNQITAPKGSDISIKIKIDNGKISFESATLNSAPKTGDDTNWSLYLMLLLGSILGIFITFVNMKKRRYRVTAK